MPLDAEADAYLVVGPEDSLTSGPTTHFLLGMERAIEGARLIFTSPLHKERYTQAYGIGHRSRCLLPPVNVEKWLSIRDTANGRNGAIWYGNPVPATGVDIAIEWAKREQVQLDVYGVGLAQGPQDGDVRINPMLSDEDIPLALASHKTYIHFPRKPDYTMTLLEVWLAGLEVVYCGNIGFESYGLPWAEVAEQASRSKDELLECVLEG